MTQELTSYKLEKYQRKLQSVSQNHPSYQVYLSKYMYYLQGGVITPELQAQFSGLTPKEKATLCTGNVAGRALSSITGAFGKVGNVLKTGYADIKKNVDAKYKSILDTNPKFASFVAKSVGVWDKTTESIEKFNIRVGRAITAIQTNPNAEPTYIAIDSA
jgi:hypothetical protein